MGETRVINHEMRMTGAGLIDQASCSCGWESRPYYDGRDLAQEEWETHVNSAETGMGAVSEQLRDFASLMVDEVIAKTRLRLDAGESISVEDQRHLLDQLVVERKRLAALATPTPETAS